MSVICAGIATSRIRPTSISARRTRDGHNPAGIVDGVDVGRFTTDLFGVDATLRWRPLTRAIYRSFVGEAKSSGAVAASSRAAAQHGLLRVRRLSVRAPVVRRRRYDRSDRATMRRCSIRAHRCADLLAERVQPGPRAVPTHDYADGPTANELLFQFQFSIGAHGAHPF